jgi:C-terminal peptidase prc
MTVFPSGMEDFPMFQRTMPVAVLVGFLSLASTPAADQSAKPHPAEVCYDYFDKVGTLVVDHHLDPPTRQEMFLGGMKALLRRGAVEPPADLSQRVSRLATDDQFRAFLKDNWPNPKSDAATTPRQLQTAFVAGMVQRLPGRLDLIPYPEAKAMEQASANRYVGTGIQLRYNQTEKRPQVVVAFLHGPLRQAGGKSGDLILEIDGVSTEDKGLSDVVERLRGEEGSKVSVTVRQPDEKEPRQLKITRGPVPFETVVGYRRLAEDRWQFRVKADEPVAYVRLASVLPSTPGELRKLEKKLLDDGIQGLVLDLRGNGGDDVQPAALTADELLDGGLLWRLRDNNGRVKDYKADRDCILRDVPVVVLVNEFTRGATEFIAAALQDNHRAKVVGTPSSGDGVVTTLFLLPNDLGGVRLPTGQVERAAAPKEPNDPAWRPVMPDHEMRFSRDLFMAVLMWQNEQMIPEAPTKAAKTSPPEDAQLAKALELLRAGLKK